MENCFIVALKNHCLVLLQLRREIWEGEALFEVLFQRMIYYLTIVIFVVAGIVL